MQPYDANRQPINRDTDAQRRQQQGHQQVIIPVAVRAAIPVFQTQIQPSPAPQLLPGQTLTVTVQDSRGNKMQKLVPVQGSNNNTPPPVHGKPYGLMQPPTQY